MPAFKQPVLDFKCLIPAVYLFMVGKPDSSCRDSMRQQRCEDFPARTAPILVLVDEILFEDSFCQKLQPLRFTSLIVFSNTAASLTLI
eukprot:4168945-Amphidinium_carterae.1